MHEAFWNGLFDTRWEDAPLGPEAIRLVLGLRDCGYAGRTRRDYGHAVVHLGRVLHADVGGADRIFDEAVVANFEPVHRDRDEAQGDLMLLPARPRSLW